MNTVCQDLLNTIENKWRVVLEDGSDITYWRMSFYREKIILDGIYHTVEI